MTPATTAAAPIARRGSPATERGSLTTQRETLRRADTRTAGDLLLTIVRDGRWSSAAWSRFVRLALLRSWDAARSHPRALAHVTLIHLPFLAAGRGHRLWVMTSWGLAATHLGMVGDHDELGVANALTLVRANLPAVEARLGAATPVVSLLSDFADGRIARGPGHVSAFGAAADFLADAAFWTWFTSRHEPSRPLRWATLAVWVLPVVGLLVVSAGRGRVVELPRSAWARPAAVVEIVLGARAVLRWASGARSGGAARRAESGRSARGATRPGGRGGHVSR